MMYHFAKVLVWIAFHIAFNFHYEGRKNIPKKTPVIYVSNHRTNADPPMVGAGVRGVSLFMAKEELFKNKFFAWFIRSLGAFSVSRGKGDWAAIDTAVECLNSGRSLVIFPEGTRSKDGKVHKGKSGAALIAAKSGRQIVPVGIVFGEKMRFRCKITVKYGKPTNTADYCEIGKEPDPHTLVKLKNVYMAEIVRLVEGEVPGKNERKPEAKANE